MAVGQAVALGAVAALTIPYFARGIDSPLGDLIANSAVHLQLGDTHLAWSWPVFGLVTLLVWALLRAAQES